MARACRQSNFAYGGATTGTAAFRAFIQDIDDRSAIFLARGRSSDAFEVFSANDFINGQTNLNVPVNSIAHKSVPPLQRALRIFVPNFSAFGRHTPFGGNHPADAVQHATAQFNAAHIGRG
jgi:hypothetical protein